MCVMSMVHDHFNPLFPPEPWQPNIVPNANPFGMGSLTITGPGVTHAELEAVRAEVARLTKLVEDFIKAKEAAAIVDTLTGQPDCVDPEKAKLEQRVAELESQLAKAREALGMGWAT